MLRLLLFILCCFGISAYGQKQNSTIISPPINATVKDANSLPSPPTSELELYKLLYANAKDANKDLSQVLQWTIGITIAFILLVLGSQYFFNIRLNEEKIKKIKAEINTDYQRLKNDIIEQKNDAIKVLSELNKDLYVKNLEKTLDRTDKLEERLGKKLSSEISNLKISLKELQGDVFFNKDEYSQALLCYINAITMRLIDNEPDFILEYKIQKITECLSKIERLWEYEAANIEKLLTQIRDTQTLGSLRKEITNMEEVYKKMTITKISKFSSPPPSFTLPTGHVGGGNPLSNLFNRKYDTKKK